MAVQCEIEHKKNRTLVGCASGACVFSVFFLVVDFGAYATTRPTPFHPTALAGPSPIALRSVATDHLVIKVGVW
eukprot:486870-Rhodomonas_salina.3